MASSSIINSSYGVSAVMSQRRTLFARIHCWRSSMEPRNSVSSSMAWSRLVAQR